MIGLDDLRAWAERGWAIFPTHSIVNARCSCGDPSCTSPGKHPRTRNGVKDATTNLDLIERWAGLYPDANWAVATGQVSGVWVLDIDRKPNVDGQANFEAWLAQTQVPNPETHTVASGGGGWHLYFAAYEHVGQRVNALPGVDVRGDGGYVLLPGSNHASGTDYALSRDVPPKVADNQLVALVRRSAPKPATSADRESILDAIPEGERNDTLFRLACSQRRKQNDDRAAVDLIVRTAGHASGLSDREIDTIIESAFQQDHSDDLTMVFPRGEPSRLNLRSAHEVLALPKPRYLIEGVMPEGGLFQVFGPTGEYKSFVMLDMLASVANGLPWMAHEVTASGPVAFVLGEGAYDAPDRLEAWLLAHPEASKDRIAYSLEEQIDLLDDPSVDAILDDLEEWRLTRFPGEPWRMIVFDTQADHMASGDEDRAGDVTRLKRAVQRIAHATGAAVGLVHHTGHDKTRERGSSRQRQAMDVVMQVQNNRIVNEKQKGAAKFEPIPFLMEPSGRSIVVRGVDALAVAAQGFTAQVDAAKPVLAYLAANPGASQNDLKRDLNLGATTWPTLRDLLERIGHIDVKRDANGNARGVCVTPLGLAHHGLSADSAPDEA